MSDIPTSHSNDSQLVVQQLILLATNLKDADYTLTKQDSDLLRELWNKWKKYNLLGLSELKLIPRTTMAFLIGFISFNEDQFDSETAK